MSDVQIEITENGPYKVTGRIELVGPGGTPVSLPDGDSVYLCRCGLDQQTVL